MGERSAREVSSRGQSSMSMEEHGQQSDEGKSNTTCIWICDAGAWAAPVRWAS